MIAIRKPGKPANNPTSYRPISLLSSISQLFERIILRRLNEHLDEQQVIPINQHGFRKGYSTITQLDILTNNIKAGLTAGSSTGMILMDIEKAFDRVWLDGLIYKLCMINTPLYIIKIISTMVRERTFKVAIQGKMSDVKSFEFGLAQGAVLSPVLYSVYTSDQPSLDANVALFADDTAISSTSRYAKQITGKIVKSTKKYTRYLEKWKIKANVDKFQAILFTRRRTRQIPTQPISLNSRDINWTNEVKYLGLILDKKLTYQKHITYAVDKANKAARIFYSMLNRRSQLNRENKILLYKVAIRPILAYGCQIFQNAAESHIKRIQRFQNKMLRTILDVRWNPDSRRYDTSTSEMHDIAGVEPIDTFFKRLHETYTHRITP